MNIVIPLRQQYKGRKVFLSYTLSSSGPSSVHCGEAANINFIVDCFDPIGLQPAIYHTHGEYTNYYTTDAVLIYYETNLLEH